MAAQTSGKSRKRLSRHEMKEDKLIAMAQQLELFYERNRKAVFGVATAILAVVVVFFLVRANQRKSFEEASVDLTMAKIVFDMGRVNDTEQQFQLLKTQHGGRIAGEAQYYLARIAFMHNDLNGAEVAFREYVDNYHVDKYLDVAAAAGLAATLESQGKYIEAAETYMAVQEKHRKHYYSAEALFEAARCYLSANQKDKAVQTYLILQRQYPTSALTVEASKAIAQLR